MSADNVKATAEATVKTDAQKKAELKEMSDKLARLEKTSGGSGAVPFTPKQALLDPGDVVTQNPDKRFRWVNVNNAEKAQQRTAQGYERVGHAEGGRQVGNLALFAIPRQVYEQRVAAIKEMNERRLSAHKTEVEQMAVSVARELRDRHGIKVDAERILIQE